MKTLSVAFKEEHGVSLLAAIYVDIVGTWFDPTSSLALVLRHTSSISGWQSFLFNAPRSSISLEILMGGWCVLGRWAAHTLTIEPCSYPGQGKNRVWSVQQSDTSKSQYSIMRSTHHLSKKAERVFCGCCEACSRNGIQPAALPFPHASTQLYPLMWIQPRARKKCSSIPCTFTSTALAANRRS